MPSGIGSSAPWLLVSAIILLKNAIINWNMVGYDRSLYAWKCYPLEKETFPKGCSSAKIGAETSGGNGNSACGYEQYS